MTCSRDTSLFVPPAHQSPAQTVCCSPRASTLTLCLLLLQVGQAFKDAADQYVRKFLDNGVPSLFSDLKPLYRYPFATLFNFEPDCDRPAIHQKLRHLVTLGMHASVSVQDVYTCFSI